MSLFLTSITLLAVVIGVTGILPQLVTMLRSRSANGQSVPGWALGATANATLGVVNLLGSHDAMLALGHLLSLSGCLVAVALVRRFRDRTLATPATPTVPVPAPTPEIAVADMHTGELALLSRAMIAEHRRRIAGRQAVAA